MSPRPPSHLAATGSPPSLTSSCDRSPPTLTVAALSQLRSFQIKNVGVSIVVVGAATKADEYGQLLTELAQAEASEVNDELGLAPSGGDAQGVRRVLFNLSGFGGSVMSVALEKAL